MTEQFKNKLAHEYSVGLLKLLLSIGAIDNEAFEAISEINAKHYGVDLYAAA